MIAGSRGSNARAARPHDATQTTATAMPSMRCVPDPRHLFFVGHSQRTLPAQRDFEIAQGCKDLSDHHRLREAPSCQNNERPASCFRGRPGSEAVARWGEELMGDRQGLSRSINLPAARPQSQTASSTKGPDTVPFFLLNEYIVAGRYPSDIASGKIGPAEAEEALRACQGIRARVGLAMRADDEGKQLPEPSCFLGNST